MACQSEGAGTGSHQFITGEPQPPRYYVVGGWPRGPPVGREGGELRGVGVCDERFDTHLWGCFVRIAARPFKQRPRLKPQITVSQALGGYPSVYFVRG